MLKDLPRQAQQLAGSAVPLDLKKFEIVGFHVVAPGEASSDVHAVIVTSKGLRLYLSHRKSYGYGYQSQGQSGQPTDLRLVHIRAPPANMVDQTTLAIPLQYGGNAKPPAPEAKPFQVTQITDTFYCNGLYIVSQPPPPIQDGSGSVLLCNFPDIPSIAGLRQTPQSQPMFGQQPGTYSRQALIENVKLLSIPGESWFIAEQPRADPTSSKSSVVFNELTSQFSDTQRELTVLSHVGVTRLAKLRPVDVLYRLIQQDSRYELELFCKR